MGRCKYHDTDYNACARYSTFGGAYQHLVPCHKCEQFEPITNYDRIKAMSKEELAEMLSDFCAVSNDCMMCPFSKNCPKTYYVHDWIKWLNSEVEE
jgi:hypothetical protein